MAEAKTINREAVQAATKAPDGATPEQGFAASLLAKGLELHDQRLANTKATAANRMMLRGLVDQDAVTPDQAKAIDTLYPRSERKAKDTPSSNGGSPAPAPDGGSPAAPPAAAKPATPPAARK